MFQSAQGKTRDFQMNGRKHFRLFSPLKPSRTFVTVLNKYLNFTTFSKGTRFFACTLVMAAECAKDLVMTPSRSRITDLKTASLASQGCMMDTTQF
jgi:hypothetical protein